ncbi:MAG: hypothetical protein K2J20_06335 [Bacilli bacterium]|nr:hypothetical protein [Bacilli bacterium]
MLKFTREEFDTIAKKYKLRRFNGSNYLLLDCNLMFVFDDKYGYACAHGVMPMELATEMYEACMDKEEKPFSNSISHALENPSKIALHPNIDVDNVLLMAEQTGKDIAVIFGELRNQALKEDYDNCYIDFSYIYSAEAFAWYIETVKAYYGRNKINVL